MYAQSSAVNAENISTASVSAILDGKERNVRYVMTNARFPTVTVMVIVSTESVLVFEDTRANSVPTSTARIPLAPAMVFVLKVLAFAKRVGKDLTARLWTRMRCSVSPTVQDMELLMLTRRLVLAMQSGQERIVLKVSFRIT